MVIVADIGMNHDGIEKHFVRLLERTNATATGRHEGVQEKP